MKIAIKNTLVILFCTTVIYACSKEKSTGKASHDSEKYVQKTQLVTSSKFTKGHRVPNETVCMVNNAYMGKKQIEVPHDGKIYYGCCEMCVERIPKDKKVREAIDPYSGKTVDKADAFIVMISDEGEVAYFENEENYNKFLSQNS